MAAKGIITIKIAGDDADLRKSLNHAGNALASWAKKAAGAFVALTIVKKVGDFMWDAADAAMEEQQQLAALHKVIGNVTGATKSQLSALDSWIEKTQLQYAVTEDQLRPAMQKLVASTRDTEKAQRDLTLAIDIARGRGIELEGVVLALSKAEAGNVTGLQRMGIQTKDAAGKTKELATILSELEQTYGGSGGSWADSLAGRFERLKLRMDEAKETIGSALLPVVEQMLPYAEKSATWVGALADNFSKVAKRDGVLKGLGAMLKEALRGLSGFLQKLDWGKVGQAVAGAIQDAIAAMGPVVLDVVLNVPNIAWAITKGQVTGPFKTVKDWFQDEARDLWGEGVVPFSSYEDGLANVRTEIQKLQTETEELDEIAQGYSDTLGDIFGQRFDLASLWDEAKGSLKRYMELFKTQKLEWAQFKDNLKTLVRRFPDMLTEILTGAKRWGPSFVSQMFSLSDTEARDVLESVGFTMNENLDALTKELQASAMGAQMGREVGLSLMNTLKNLKWGATGAQVAWEFVRGFGTPSVYVDVIGRRRGGLTEHAEGGVFNRPHIGIVAEKGPEAIVPLSNPTRAADVMQEAGLIPDNTDILAELRAIKETLQRMPRQYQLAARTA
jgi:hypothetical protein